MQYIENIDSEGGTLFLLLGIDNKFSYRYFKYPNIQFKNQDSWYLERFFKHQDVFSELIEKHKSFKNIVLLGNSKGGFASILHGTHLAKRHPDRQFMAWGIAPVIHTPKINGRYTCSASRAFNRSLTQEHMRGGGPMIRNLDRLNGGDLSKFIAESPDNFHLSTLIVNPEDTPDWTYDHEQIDLIGDLTFHRSYRYPLSKIEYPNIIQRPHRVAVWLWGGAKDDLYGYIDDSLEVFA